LHRLCQQQFVLRGKRKELLTAKVRKGVAKIAKKTLLVVVKRSEVEIFALIGVLLCILNAVKICRHAIGCSSRYSLTHLAVNSVPLACILSNQFKLCFLA